MGAKHILVLLHLSHILVSYTNAAGSYVWCNETEGNFTSSSTSRRNRDLLASSLASNAATSPDGYYNTSIGEGSSRVFGLAHCQHNYSSEPEACSTCITTAFEDLVANDQCSNRKEAMSKRWGPPCIMRFADHFFFGTLQLSPVQSVYNTGDINSNLTNFDIVWGNLMESVLTKASGRGASSKLKYFGTGEAELIPFQKIYALMQCTADISESDCRRCLRSNIESYQRCCHGKQGGYVLVPSCYFQWEIYPFYQLEDVVTSPSPSPPPSTPRTPIQVGKRGSTSPTPVAIIIPAIIAFILISVFGCTLIMLRRSKPIKKETDGEIESGEGLQFEFSRIREATNDFSEDNKLGEGGFGVVYKGKLVSGLDVAVKRLSKNSNQGRKEFENEVLYMVKLQHRNLVRLLGFAMQGVERLLVYEFLPLSSLDKYISDPTKSSLLDWDKRYRIITGIARGILYLHEDSQLRIIHRDLKASNILLDADMNPKISDFGMAMLFPTDITQVNASRVVGTLGYMAPEYVQNGRISVKIDVYSFGVLVLEIISGQLINRFSGEGEEFSSLVSYAWESWKKGTIQNFLDPNLRGALESEVMRCIHLALLCVQDNAANRPSVASVVLMLGSSISVPLPSRPAFLLHSLMPPERPLSARSGAQVTALAQSDDENIQFSNNEASLSEIAPR